MEARQAAPTRRGGERSSEPADEEEGKELSREGMP